MHAMGNLWGLLRILFGWVFFWPFLDKTFGLGFSTEAGKGWIDGNSPTFGFLKFGTQGPFAEFFQGLAGNPLVDWLFMVGLFAIGLSLLLGVLQRLAGVSGFIMMALMYLAVLPPDTNPLIDSHIIYGLLLLGFVAHPPTTLGLGRWWQAQDFVKRNRWMV